MALLKWKWPKLLRLILFIFFPTVVFGYCKNIQLIAVFFKTFLAEEAKIVSCAGDFFSPKMEEGRKERGTYIALRGWRQEKKAFFFFFLRFELETSQAMMEYAERAIFPFLPFFFLEFMGETPREKRGKSWLTPLPPKKGEKTFGNHVYST